MYPKLAIVNGLSLNDTDGHGYFLPRWLANWVVSLIVCRGTGRSCGSHRH